MDKNKENFQEAANRAKEEEVNAQLEKLMFVYFDESGNIKCISPVEDDSHDEEILVTKMPIKNVYRFITGEIAPNKFMVVKKKGKVNEYDIVERLFEFNHVRKLDRFLTEVDMKYVKDFELEIIANLKTSTITFNLANHIVLEFLNDIDDTANASINGFKVLKFYCTTKNDPSMLIETFNVPVSKLLRGSVHVEYKSKLEDHSIFTRKVFTKYAYTTTKGKK